MTRPALTPDRWARVQEVLLDALEHEGPAREGVVARACVGDPALEADVRSLIAAHEADGLLPDTVETTAAEPATLQWVGPYQLLRELGRGGMGTVYLAERAGDGFTQRVALKLMRPDYADPHIIAAISAERRILARLEHPGIARFIDGGTTSSGQPFIAMEHVDGTPILQHADAAGLDVRGRVALLMDVCAAVQHAHQQLVVHRDLKPANILVAGDGRAKLLDFGIATVLDEPVGASSGETALWLTPAYASPEQIRRQPVTTLTDVYALGAVLYELLASRPAHDLGDGSLPAITHGICDVMPPAPSLAAAASGHADRARAIAGDLDHVVLRALAKSPADRYGSVEQLCEDLGRWLEGLPVRAGPDSVARRVRRFVRRHRTLAVAGAVTLVALLGGLSTTLWQARRAQVERDRAREALGRSEHVTAFLLGLFDSADPRQMSGDTTFGRAILRLGLDRVQELDGQPTIQADVLDALGRVLGSIGQLERSSELHLRALALRRATLGPADPGVATSLVALATSLRLRSRYVEAEARLREALALQQAAFGTDDPRVAATTQELAFLLPYRGREQEAESLHQVARDIFTRTVGPDDPRTLTARLRVAARLGTHDLPGAEAAVRALREDSRRVLGEDDPFTAMLDFYIGDYVVRRAGDPAEAERLYRSGIARIEGREGTQRLDLIHGLHSLGGLLARRGEHAEAEALYRRALGINETLLGANHPGTAGTMELLAGLYEREGRLLQAERMRVDVLERMERALGPDHATVAGAREHLARLEHRMGHYARAETLWREAIDGMRRALGDEHQSVLRSRLLLAATLAATGRTTEAAQLCAEGVATIKRLFPPEHVVQREARAESPHCNWNGADP